MHDGGIESITRQVPGKVSIEISIRYLRQQFPGVGTGFRIDLSDCEQFSYQEYDAPPITDFGEIVALDPEILGVEEDRRPIVVNCVMGSLTMSYGTVSIYLDTGEKVSYDELAAASKTYWDAWAASNSQRR